MFNKLKGALLGYIVGDALGVPVEFKERETLKKYPICEMVGYGTHHQPAGTWSDDTSMTLATMEWVMEGEDSTLQDNDLMDKFINWLTKGEYTAHGITFDYGNATAEALMRYTKEYQPYECGGTSAQSNGNGSLMRMLPIALWCAKNNLNEEELRQFVEKVSAFTHAHARSKMGCFLYVNIIMGLLKNDGDKKVIIQNSLNKCKAFYTQRIVEAELKELKHYERIFDVSLFQALPEL